MTEKNKAKILAIYGGCDWYDASVEHLVIPNGTEIDVKEEKAKYDRWYEEIYCNRASSADVKYITFSEWLVRETKVRKATEEDIIEFRED